MTYEEALNICRLAKEAIAVKYNPNNDANDVESMMRKMQEQVAESADLDFMIAAIEKQIPKKPKSTRGEIAFIVCPKCETLVGSAPYCRYCGQRIDWGNDDE